jgi:hypothetical protein
LSEDQIKEEENIVEAMKYEGMVGVAEMQRTSRMMFLLKGEGGSLDLGFVQS